MTPYFIIVGRSASGKTTIMEKLMDYYHFSRTVTSTTREARNEENQESYHFISIEEFKDTTFVETVEYVGSYYGTSKDSVDSSDIVAVEIEGAKALKNYCEEINRPCVIIGLDVSRHIAEKRMLARGDNLIDIRKRLEYDDKLFKDFSGICDIFFYDFNMELDFPILCNCIDVILADVIK